MANYLPQYDADDNPSIVATAAITGGLMITGAGAVAGAAALNVIGVAAHDAAIGDTVTYFKNGVQRITAGTGGLNAGDLVKSDANGNGVTATPTTDIAATVGVCIQAAAAGAVALVDFK